MTLPIITADQRLAEPRGIKGCIFGKSGIGQSLVGGDGGQGHCAPPCGRISTFSVPVRTVRAGSKPWRMASGQAT